MPRFRPYEARSPKRSSKTPTPIMTRPYVSSLCAALGQELPSGFALAPPPPPVLAPSQPASGGPPHPPVSETNTARAQHAESSIHQPRAVRPFQQLFRPPYNPPFPSPANPPFSAPSNEPFPPPFNNINLPPSHNGYSQLSDDRHHPAPNRFFSQPYHDSVPSGSNDPFPPLSNDLFPSLSTGEYPSSSNAAFPSLSTRADAYPSSSNGPFPPSYNQPESSSTNGPFFAPEDWPLSSFAVDEYYMSDGSGPSSFPTSSDYSYAAHDDAQPHPYPPAASNSYSEDLSWATITQQASYGLPHRPEYLPPPDLAPVPVPIPVLAPVPVPAYPRIVIGHSVLCGESSVEAPVKPPVAARRVIRIPLPPGTCNKYVQDIYVRGELGLQCRACPGIRRTSLNEYIVQNVDGAGMVMDDVFPDETVLVHRGLFACDPGAACVFNMASHKSPRHNFTLGRLLTMIVDKQYKAWYSKKWKAGLDLQKIVGAAEEPVRGTAVSYAMVYIVAIRRWRHGKGKWHYFPELEIRL